MSGAVNTAKTVARLAKPQLRGACARYMTRAAYTSGACALAVALAFKYLVAEPRKRAYAEFYRLVLWCCSLHVDDKTSLLPGPTMLMQNQNDWMHWEYSITSKRLTRHNTPGLMRRSDVSTDQISHP